MRFDDPQLDDEPIQPKSIVPADNRVSRAIRIKLTMLFAMLLLVIFLMKEAGKPERWEWMGFDKNGKPHAAVESDANTIELSGQVPKDKSDSKDSFARQGVDGQTSDAPLTSPETASTSPQANPNGPIRIATESTRPVLTQRDDQTDYPVAAITFWQSTFRKMNAEQQNSLLSLLKSIRLGQSVPEVERKSAQQLVRSLNQLRERFQQDLFDQLAVSPDGADATTRLANEMYESAEIWEQQIQPAFEASSLGKEFTIGQLKSVERLQSVFDPMIYDQVQDRTSIGWKGDPAAWKRMWEKATSSREWSDVQRVKRIELMGQPDYYRGREVEVEGWVRRARKEALDPNSELPFSHYYVLWMRPLESKLGPYCVYATTLPDDFPPVNETDSELNEHVRLQGYFFKVRNFVAGDSSVDNCPLLIANSLQRVEVTQFTAVDRWQPSRTILIAAFILIPIFATGLAWLAFRNSRTKRYVPGKKMKSKIDQTLQELADDPDVQTDREKVMALYDSESSNAN